MSNVPENRRNQIKLLLLLALFVAPVVASYVVFYFWQPQQRTNYGELLPPKPVPETTLQLTDGSPFSFARMKGKWILLTVDSGACKAYCLEKLYDMRQVRLTQGKDMDRIERVWLIDDEVAPAAATVAEFDGTWVVRAQRSPLLKWLPATHSSEDHIYLIDPLGNLIMRYPRSPDARKMVKDIVRLLKVSQVG